jgi:hypothetical protein
MNEEERTGAMVTGDTNGIGNGVKIIKNQLLIEDPEDEVRRRQLKEWP